MKLRNKKTGEIGYLLVGKGSNYYIVTNDEWEDCGKYGSLSELNEEWEDVEEPKAYWYIDDAGVMQVDQILSSKINMRKSIGNYFETREEAEKAVEKLNAWRRLEDKGFKITNYNCPFRELYFEVDEEKFFEANGEASEETCADLGLLFGGGDD
jgi:hypothetical protein